MSNSHLINTIRLYCKNLAQARQNLSQPISIDPMAQVLANIDRERIQKCAREVISTLHSNLSPYVFEAALRGLNIQTDLQLAYGRSEAIPLYEGGSFLELEAASLDGEEF